MVLEKHDLHAEFPEYEQEIHELKVNNSRFARLFEDYHHKVEHECIESKLGLRIHQTIIWKRKKTSSRPER